MLNKQLHQFWVPPTDSIPTRRTRFWLILSLVFTVVYGSIELRTAFSGEFIIQDDARQHVFWMMRFLDPELFPKDLIADYYQSVAPAGYVAVYRIMAFVGISPLVFNKLLPMLLSLVTTAYCFGVGLQLLPIPAMGFMAALMLNQNLWLQDDLGSGTARAFVYPIFMAFLYYLLRRSLLPCLVTIALAGLIYPQFVFIVCGVLILRLVKWEGRLRWSGDRQNYLFCGIGLVVAFAVMLPYALEISQYDPVVTLAEAKTMPEFAERGRNEFFYEDTWKFWIGGGRTGALAWVMPLGMAGVLLLPILLRLPRYFPLVNRVKNVGILWQVGFVSAFLFFAAHAVLFKLYLPSRYAQSSWQVISALAGALFGLVVLDAIYRWIQNAAIQVRSGLAIATTTLMVVLLIGSPHLYHFPNSSFIIGNAPTVYRFFAEQPKNILVASISTEADRIPSFSQRSILTAREYSIPYHMGYYNQMRQRTLDLIKASYSPNLSEVQEFIRQYGIDFWLLDRDFMTSTRAQNNSDQIKVTRWLQQFQPLVRQVNRQLSQGTTPAVTTLIDRCAVLKTRKLNILDAQCILSAPDAQRNKKE
jgi:hypothetical protein